ncbi:hypothetical protein HHK36_002136 [Tetracentron sinense]|uniref:Uncharacterized protein n=1 Tax=Tetracentron sinense TaxID=13715 RepID=A0A835DVQ2_TETSI|nr:hypothetical protein HHK36_002136 [Tetracentron sinense]
MLHHLTSYISLSLYISISYTHYFFRYESLSFVSASCLCPTIHSSKNSCRSEKFRRSLCRKTASLSPVPGRHWPGQRYSVGEAKGSYRIKSITQQAIILSDDIITKERTWFDQPQLRWSGSNWFPYESGLRTSEHVKEMTSGKGGRDQREAYN